MITSRTQLVNRSSKVGQMLTRDFSGVQQTVDIAEESFICDLAICEHEDHWLALDTSNLQGEEADSQQNVSQKNIRALSGFSSHQAYSVSHGFLSNCIETPATKNKPPPKRPYKFSSSQV